MLEIIPESGFFTKKMIKTVNALIKKINRYERPKKEKDRPKPEEVIKACQKLQDLYEAKFKPPKIVDHSLEPVVAWYRANLTQVTILSLSLKLEILAKKAQLADIYGHYNGKDSFRRLVEEHLKEQVKEKEAEVTELGGLNNPVVRVTFKTRSENPIDLEDEDIEDLEEQHQPDTSMEFPEEQRQPDTGMEFPEDTKFIMRFVQFNKKEIEEGLPLLHARKLLSDIDEIPPPLLLKPVNNERNHQGTTYLECGLYYEHGNLEKIFSLLHQKSLDPKQKHVKIRSEIERHLLRISAQLIEFYIKINNKAVYHTDMKSPNILLSKEGEIKFSDVKGLVISDELLIAANKINTTQDYYQSSVFTDNAINFGSNDINLLALQRQTLATTLYQLLSNRLPLRQDQEIKKTIAGKEKKLSTWKLNYNFELPCFQTERGRFFKTFIQSLNNLNDLEDKPLASFLAEVNDFKNREELKLDMAEEMRRPMINLNESPPPSASL